MTRVGRLVLSTLLVALALVGCGRAATPTTTAPDLTLNKPFVALESAVDDYLALKAPTTASDMTAFFDEGRVRLATARAKLDMWQAAVAADNAPTTDAPANPSRKTLDAYSSAMDTWLSAQSEQTEKTQACLAGADAKGCYTAMLATNGTRWQQAATELNAAKADLNRWATASPSS